MRLNSAVVKVFICENSHVWRILCFNICTRTQNRLPCDITKWSTLLNMHWAARHFNPCSLKHENYCLDTFYFCWVYNQFDCDNLVTVQESTAHTVICILLHVLSFGQSKMDHSHLSNSYIIYWARPCENVSDTICEQQRCRSACASAQSDQHLCCSLLG